MSPMPTPQRPWTDPRRHLWLLSPATPLLGVAAIALYHASGWTMLTWSGPIFIYGLVQFLEWWIGTDPANPPEEAVAQLEDDAWYRHILYAYLPSQYVLTLWGGWLFVHRADGWVAAMGLALTVGAINGLATISKKLGSWLRNLQTGQLQGPWN